MVFKDEIIVTCTILTAAILFYSIGGHKLSATTDTAMQIDDLLCELDSRDVPDAREAG